MGNIRIANFLYPYVRFFCADPYVKSADLYMGNSLMASNVAFNDFSPYLKGAKGRQDFKITQTGQKENVLARLTLDLSDGEVYTIAAASDNGKTIAYAIAEPTRRDNLSYGHIRICNLSPNAGTVDVFANQYAILGDLRYLEVSRYIEISPGKYDIKIGDTDLGETVLNAGPQVMRSGVYNTLYLTGLASENPPLSAVLSVDAASYTGYYL